MSKLERLWLTMIGVRGTNDSDGNEDDEEQNEVDFFFFLLVAVPVSSWNFEFFPKRSAVPTPTLDVIFSQKRNHCFVGSSQKSLLGTS